MNFHGISEQDIFQIKKDILQEIFPAECDLLGEIDLKKILSGPLELKKVSTGSLLNFHDIYETMAAAIDFINNCLSIYINQKGLISKEASAPKLIEELLTNTTTTTINNEEKQIIIKEVQRHLKRYA